MFGARMTSFQTTAVEMPVTTAKTVKLISKVLNFVLHRGRETRREEYVAQDPRDKKNPTPNASNITF